MTEWRFIILKSAQRYLKRLSKIEQERIIRALKSLLKNPEQANIKSLKGRSELRLRVGEYRILLFRDRENQIYIVSFSCLDSSGDRSKLRIREENCRSGENCHD